MSSRSATVLVIFIVACLAFCLASVFGSMTGPISILPNESDSGSVLDNLSAITDSDNNYESYGDENVHDYSNDYSSQYSSQSSDTSNVETTTDDSSSQPQQDQSHDSSSDKSDNKDGSSSDGDQSDSGKSNVITYIDK